MSFRQLLRKPHYSLPTPISRGRPCFQSSSSSSSSPRDRVDRILARLPRRLQPYASGLRAAPVRHLVSFLVLHEITAVVPLVGLSLGFHYSGGWLPDAWKDGSYLAPGIERFGKYFRRKGWFGLGDEEVVTAVDGNGKQAQDVTPWKASSPGMRIVVEVAAAYAITKALLPARLMLSVWLTPWFARVVMGRIWGAIRGLGKGRGVSGGTAMVGKVEKAAIGNKGMGTSGMGKDAKTQK